MSDDAITSIPNLEEQASLFQDDGESCVSFEESAGNPSTENFLSGKALPTIKRGSLFSRLKYVPSVYVKLSPLLTWST